MEATLNEFIKNGVKKIRFFDALNHIDNLYIPESVREKEGIVLQAAMFLGIIGMRLSGIQMTITWRINLLYKSG